MNTLRLTVILSAVLAPLLPGVIFSQAFAQSQTPPAGFTQSGFTSSDVVNPPVTFPPASSGAPSPGANIRSPGAGITSPGAGVPTPGVGINPAGTLPPANGQAAPTATPTTTQNSTNQNLQNGTVQPGVNQPTTIAPLNNQSAGQVLPAGVPGTTQTVPGGVQPGVTQPTTGVPAGTQNLQGTPGTTGTQNFQGTPGTGTQNLQGTPGTQNRTPGTGTQNLQGAGQRSIGAGTQITPGGSTLGPVQIIPGVGAPAPQTSPQARPQAPTPATQAAPSSSPAQAPATTQVPSAPFQQGTLDTALLQATCAQDWQRAIRIVNTAISAAPANQQNYRATLVAYRSRLQSLQANGVRVPNWQQQCRTGNIAAQR